ncbi:MAG: serine protease Do [Nonlabens sp.]|jgi:Do/DeqQ family serine protease
MNTKKLYLSMLISSFLGGFIALGTYTVIKPDLTPLSSQVSNEGAPVSFTNYVFDTTDYVVPQGLNFVFAAKSATPGVVHIRTKYSATRKNAGSQPMEKFLKEYFGEPYDRRDGSPSMGAGSGVIITSDGYIATNNHVIEGASEIEVLLNDNSTYPATIVGVDPDTDLALIKVEGTNLPTVAFGDSEQMQIGEWVLAIGNPFDFRSTVTAGIVSAKARNINILARSGSNTRIEAFIQTDAAVNPGNSGGALVNLKGELVGINTAIASPTGAFAGYSFAVPATLVKKVIYDLRDFGAVQRPLLGIQIVDVSAELAKSENLDVLKGVFIARVNEGTSAQEAGLKEKDVIIAINGKKVSNVAQLQEQVALNRPGDKIDVTYIREGKTKTTKATLKNQYLTTEIVTASSTFELEGAVLEPVSETLKNQHKIKAGVQVKSLEKGKWKDAGIESGFIITEIDQRPIVNRDDMESALRAAKDQGVLIEGIYPNGEKAYYGIGW